MKKVTLTMLCLCCVELLSAQNIIVQQSNSTQHQEPKVVYKEKVVYVEKKQQGPILVAGYLWVYPERLGDFKKCPTAIINAINKKHAYGKNTWRLPTKEEYDIIRASNNINLKDYGVGETNMHVYYSIWTYEEKDYNYSEAINNIISLILVSDE